MKKLAILFFFLYTFVEAQRVEPLIFQEKVHDFGEIEEKGGKVEFEFTFVNNTARPIHILSVEASCGCTTTGYSKEEIKQGKKGFVKASFDPNGRPGYFNKSISVVTDYEPQPILLQIKGQVNSGLESNATKDLTAKNGNLRLKHNSFSFSKVFINREPIEKEFMIMNAGEKPIRFLGKVISPQYISVIIPETIQPNQTATIKIRYDARKRNQYGFFSDVVEWQSDDELQQVKSFPVYATIEEYFSPLTEAEKSNSATLKLESNSISIGRIAGEAEIQREVTLKNIGKKSLVIRALQPNCTCINSTITKNNLSPNEEVKLSLVFNPQGRVGQQNKSVTIYSTDPQNPVQRIIITGYIPN